MQPKHKQQIHGILDPQIKKAKMPDTGRTTLDNLTKTAMKAMIKS